MLNCSPEQYLELDNQSEFRNEYVDGEICALARASKNHRRLVFNLSRHLDLCLAGSQCQVDGPECRVFVPARTVYLYPDVLVTCGEEEYLGAGDDTLLNPLLVIEVLSPSTEDYDHGKKFAYYRSLLSFREYQHRSDEIRFQSVPARLSLQNVYENIWV